MDGIYYKEWSAVLDRAMELRRSGHSGVPVLALPARWQKTALPGSDGQNHGRVLQ